MADERLCNPISTPELERRWAAPGCSIRTVLSCVSQMMPNESTSSCGALRPMVRHDEDMALGTSMNIGLHPIFGNARLFVTVCDNFLIGPDGKIENIHHKPRKIFEL